MNTNTSTKDYYKVLGVQRKADTNTILKAYKRLALKYHPDRNLDSPQSSNKKFLEISEAAEILRDKRKRGIYDNYGVAGLEQKRLYEIDPMQLFTMVFGKDDQYADAIDRVAVDLTLNECYNGVSKKVNFLYFSKCGFCTNGYTYQYKTSECRKCSRGEIEEAVRSICTACAGIGNHGMHIVECPKCKGTKKCSPTRLNVMNFSCTMCDLTGQVLREYKCVTCNGSKSFVEHILKNCNTCQGKGVVYTRKRKTCVYCTGNGKIAAHANLKVKIPAGSRDQDVVPVLYKNFEAQVDGQVLVTVCCKENSEYKFQHNDLYLVHPIKISLYQAFCGGHIAFNHFGKPLFIQPSYRIIQSGELHKIAGKGMSATPKRPIAGDLFVKFEIVMPKNEQMNPEKVKQICNFLPPVKHCQTNNAAGVELQELDEFDRLGMDDDRKCNNEKPADCKQM